MQRILVNKNYCIKNLQTVKIYGVMWIVNIIDIVLKIHILDAVVYSEKKRTFIIQIYALVYDFVCMWLPSVVHSSSKIVISVANCL